MITQAKPDNQLRVFDHLDLFTDDWAGETQKVIRSEVIKDQELDQKSADDHVKELFGGSRSYPHPRSDRLAHLPTSSEYVRQADPFDENASLGARALSYLHANCASLRLL